MRRSARLGPVPVGYSPNMSQSDRAPETPETDPANTDHPTGEDQAEENAENEAPA